MATQLERVLAASRSRGGTCQADWLATETPDRGPRITRVGARVQEAEDKLGCVFECIGWRGKTKIYHLVSEPDAESERREDIPLPETVADTPSAASPPAPALSAGQDQEALFTTPSRPHWLEEAA
jgi:hypothetical protein